MINQGPVPERDWLREFDELSKLCEAWGLPPTKLPWTTIETRNVPPIQIVEDDLLNIQFPDVPSTEERQQVVKALLPRGWVTEVRAIGAHYTAKKDGSVEERTGVFAGVFDDAEPLCHALFELEAKRPLGIYLVLNSPKVDACRVTNRVRLAKTGECLGDDDIDRYRFVLVDFDPDRPTGVSSTDAEHRAALARAGAFLGVALPLGMVAFLTDSGNGAHVLIRVDFEHTVENKQLVQAFLHEVAEQFGDDQVGVDLTTFSPAQLVKFPASQTAKGPHTSERPHRCARVLMEPYPRDGVTPRECLERFAFPNGRRGPEPLLPAKEQPAPEPANDVADEDDDEDRFVTALAKAGFTLKGKPRVRPDRTVYVLTKCPFHPHPSGHGKAHVTLWDDGRITAGCKATKCLGKTWKHLAALYPDLGEHRVDDHLNLQPVRLDAVVNEPVEWIWPGRVPRGKVSLWAGLPGVGKGWASAWLVAAVTRGSVGPEGPLLSEGDVLVFNAEDGLGDTFRPRVEQMGGDLRRVHVESQVFALDATGLRAIRACVAKIRPVLVIIDPLAAYMGAKVDMNRANQTRPIFAGLGEIADTFACAVLAIHHLNKGEGRQGLLRISGSIDIVAAVRAAFLFGINPSTPGHGAMLPVKMNIANRPPALGYSVANGRFEWTGDSALTEQDLLLDAPAGASRLDEAKEFLVRALQGGPRAQREVESEARSEGIAQATLMRAKKALHVRSAPQGATNGKPGADHWVWFLDPVTPFV